MDIPVFLLPAHRMRNGRAVLNTIRVLKSMIRHQQFALVQSNGFRAHVYGGLAAYLARVPETWLVHTFEKPTLSTAAILKIPAARVLANTPRTAAFFVEHGFSTTVIWPSVDAVRLGTATPRAELAARFGLPTNARWVSMAARLQRYKGQEFFLRTLAALPSRLSDVHGIVIGGALFGMEASYVGELKTLALELGVADRVSFTGFISDADVYGLVTASEVLVHPALHEDFGLIVAEAQALGTPVLAFDSSGPAMIVADGQTGRLVPVGDLAAMESALIKMLDEPEILRRWGEASGERALSRFAAERTAHEWERAFDACIFGEIHPLKPSQATAHEIDLRR
jgi:glycosyltransferase involved in cell wall biosynthesis